MKTHTVKWLVAGAVGAGMLAFSMGANAAGTSGTTGIDVSQPTPARHLLLAASECGGVVKASASDAMAKDDMKTDAMAKDDMKTDAMAKDDMKTDAMASDDKAAHDKKAADKMASDKMAKDDMKTDVMAKAKDCAAKDTMTN